MPVKKSRRISTIFRPLIVCEKYVLVTGGYNRHPEATLHRSTIVDGSEKLMFLKMEAREPWLLAGAAGSKKISHGLTNRTTLCADLRMRLEQACNGMPTSADDIRCRGGADAPSQSVASDPMNEVADDEILDTAAVKKEAARRTRWFSNHCKNKVIEVAMPERAPQTGCDEGLRMVRLYCEDRKTIWLCTKDADWALAYLRDQMDCKGVVHVSPDDPGPGKRRRMAQVRVQQPVLPALPVVAGPLPLGDGVLAMTDTVDGGNTVETDRITDDMPASSDFIQPIWRDGENAVETDRITDGRQSTSTDMSGTTMEW